MSKKLVITRFPVYGRVCTVMALLESDVVVEISVTPTDEPSLIDNIYLGKVVKLIPEIHGAFIDIRPGCSCYFSTTENSQHSLKNGDEVLVQVAQEALKLKAPKVTTNLNLAGEYLAVTTEGRGIGVSTKLDSQTRKNLKSWVEPFWREGTGIVVRTNAESASKEEILEELDYLYRRMDLILKKGQTRTCYSLIEEAQPFYIHRLRGIRKGELEKVVTDIPEIQEELQHYFMEYQQQDLAILNFYEDALLPLYKLYSLERVMEDALHKKVWLKSGGFLMIEQTEAFVSIDVNTGKYVGKKKASETYRKINLEAAKEIARQLRLRNLYGIILVDFINMENPDHCEELFHVLNSYLKKDPVRTRAIDMTKLQIMEITRKKTKKSLHEQINELRKAKEA